jgi:hypothetical protein
MFHDKTQLPGDKQYWNKINATGMDQFEVNMNYLWIKQVSRIIFILKFIFYIFFHLSVLWTALNITGKYGG